MVDILQNLSILVSVILADVRIAVDVIVRHPFLLLAMGFFVVGGAIGILGRLISRR